MRCEKIAIFLFSGSSVRQQVQCCLAKQYQSVEEAENAMGVTLESYLDGECDTLMKECTDNLKSPDLSDIVTHLTQQQAVDVLHQILECTEVESRSRVLQSLCQVPGQ